MQIWEEGNLRIGIKDKEELDAMREGGKILGEVLHELKKMVRPGIVCADLDKKSQEIMDAHGVIPAFKGYQGFPATLCACVNEQVVHCIPGQYELKEGDILTIDCGVLHKGFNTDSAITVGVGKIGGQASDLIATAEKALSKAISTAGPGVRIRNISGVIQDIVEKKGFSVIYDLTGHGIGKKLHEDPVVPNFRDSELGPMLRPGMTIAIEPIISAGSPQIKILRDGWTYVTVDRSLSAQVEHTIAITEKGVEVLTGRPQ